MTTGLSASPTTEIWPKVWEIRGAVAADAENPMARVVVSISMLLRRVRRRRQRGSPQAMMPATAMNESWKLMSNR